jgi:hypothetical protein
MALAIVAALSCGRDRSLAPTTEPSTTPITQRAGSLGPTVALDEPGAIDLLEPLRNGAIDSTGPIVDLGEAQSAAFVLPPVPSRVDEVNGDSWAEVGPRLRLRVPIDTTVAPDRIRLRIRRARAHRVLALVDGVPVRQALLPEDQGAHVIELPVAPERFARESALVELRFLGGIKPNDDSPSPRGPRAVLPPVISAEEAARSRDAGVQPSASTTSASSAQPAQPRQPTVVEIDWVHVCRAGAAVARVTDLVADVRVDRTPRRSLTLYPPTRASWVTVLPASATLRTAVTAEGVRGGNVAPVRARIRIEVDDASPVEREVEVRANTPWTELSLDLAQFAHKAARISFAAIASDDPDAGVSGSADAGVRTDIRVAFADPRVIARTEAPAPLPTARHALFIVVRGLRVDRILPQINGRFAGGGFQRMAREGIVARAQVASGRELPALASALTGLSPDGHRIEEWTDTHDERAPTMGTLLREGGMATALFADDKWIEGSGLDRGYGEVRTCPGEAARCRAEIPFGLAAEWLVARRDRRAFAVVVTRAGVPPLDPPRDLLLQFDPNPAENALQPEGTAAFALSPRASPSLNLDRLMTLYDAAIANVDRVLAQAMDRLREANLLDQCVIVLVGSRGTALGEEHFVGEGPARLVAVHETAVMVRAPGVRPRVLTEVVSSIDANATILERLGVTGPWVGPLAPVSLAAVSALGAHPRGFVSALGVRNEPALRFGALLALTSRGGSNVVLLEPERDPMGAEDLRTQKPIALAFAERTLSSFRDAGGNDPERFSPSTRALSDAVVTALRQGTARH